MKPQLERKSYRNVFDALIRISREEGTKKLYSGLAPNILRGMSMNVGMLACYDQVRNLFRASFVVRFNRKYQAKEVVINNITHDQNRHSPSQATQLISSAIAGFTAAAFSLPFDLLKSRLRTLLFITPYTLSIHMFLFCFVPISLAEDGSKYSGLVDAFVKTLTKEGPLAFWTGFGAYYGRYCVICIKTGSYFDRIHMLQMCTSCYDYLAYFGKYYKGI
jgi:solute carrier family 25 oxoglutarate transporter 11